MVTPLEALNNFISKDEYDDLGKYHEPDPNHMTPGYGTPNKKSTFPKQTGDFTHAYKSFETQPHSVTFKYQGGVKAVHQNHYSQADHFKQQSYHIKQAKAAKAAGADAAQMGHTNAAAAHGYQARNMVQPGHDTLTFSRVGSHHGGRYDDGAHLPWVGKANENSFRDKLLKNPDIIPPKGQRKEEVVDALIKQKIRQKDNNKRANNLLNAEIADPGGGSKAGGDSAMYRLSEFVQKPIEAAEDDAPPIWGKPKDSHIKKANRLIELVDIDPDEVKIDDPPKHKSKRHTAELEFIKQFKDKLDDESFIDEVSLQDDDLEEPFKRYIRDNDLELSSDEKDNLEQINRDASTLVHKFKIFYNRQRPHQADDNIDEIENTAGKSPSYPSGHSTNSYVIGEYLANKFPEHADELRNIGKKIGLNRVIVGLHYPSDHIAGVELGQQVVRGIPGMTDVKKSDAFMDELFKYMEHREELFKDMTQIGTQDILDGVRIDKENNPRIPRKKGQPAKSDKHSDLYTDEDPKDTIQGLGFKNDATAKASVKKIKDSGRAHAHKIQAAVAMEQRAKAAGKSSEAGIYRKYIDSMKKKTQEMEKHTEEHHTVEHISEENPFSMDAAKESLDEQLKQIKNKIETGDYDIKKSEDIFLEKAPDYTFDKFLTPEQFDEFENFEEFEKYREQFLRALEAKVDAFQGGDNARNSYTSARKEVETRLNKLNEPNFDDSGKKIYEQLNNIPRLDDLLDIEIDEEKIKTPPIKEGKPIKEEKPDPPNNGGGKPPKQEYVDAHKRRIEAIQQARQELNTHLDSFNKVKATATDPTFQKMGHMEKFNNARDKYDKAVGEEEKYRNRLATRGTERPNPTEDEEFKDLFSDVTAPEYTDADNAYIEEKNKLINLGRKKGLIDWYYEQNHSSEFDEHHENRKGAEAELLNQPLSKLRVAFKNLAKTIPDDSGGSDGGDDGGTKVSQVSDAELRAHEREMVKRGEEISDKYFDKDEDGRFVLKPDLDKHDVLMGMREMERLMNEDWKGEDNKFNREEDGSVTDNDDRFAKEQNRKKVLGNKSFNQLVAIGAQIGSQGLVQRFGMTPKQAENVVAKIHQEYREEGENFMSDEHRKKVDEEGKAALEESNKAHADYKLHAEGTSKDPTRPQDYVSHAHSPASSATVHTDEEAKDFQKPMTVADVASAQAEIDKMKISDAEKEKERIRQGLPPTDSTPPMFQDEEGNPTVQAVWHKETHKWAKPDTLQTGKDSSGHYDTMPDDSFIHISDNEFNNMQGDTFFPEGEEMRSEKYNTLSTTPKGGMIAYKDKDGNMQYFRGKSKLDAFHNQEHLAEAGQDGTSSENHAKRQANVEALIDHAVSNFQGTAFGGKQAYRIDSITGSIQKVGDVDFKPRQVFTKVGKVSRLGRRVASSLRRFGDKYESNLRNEDAILFINDAKKYARRKGKRPTIIVNDGMNRTRFSKFTKDQQKEISRFANLHVKNPNGTYKRLMFPED